MDSVVMEEDQTRSAWRIAAAVTERPIVVR
jgi:hypothetical protein